MKWPGRVPKHRVVSSSLSDPSHKFVWSWGGSVGCEALRHPRPLPWPAYHPQMGPADVAALERLVRRPRSEQRLVERARLALLLHAQPTIGNTAAARQLGHHPNWVHKWRKRWATAGFALAAL